MSEYAPGTVAVATVLGARGVRLSRYDGGWARLDDPDIFYSDGACKDGEVSDVRPLVVLDLTPHDVMRVVDCLRADRGLVTLRVADEIEAQTKPPRIKEPTDPSVRVKTGSVEWARVGPWWVSADLGEVPRDWDYLADRDPEVLS